MFAKLMKAREVTIDATVLLADLRGYTRLSQTKTSKRISEVLDGSYDECTETIWDRDGLLNKTMGDAVMAIFNFRSTTRDHPRQPVLAAQDIQKCWTPRLRSLERRARINRRGPRRWHRHRLRGSELRRVRTGASRAHSHRHRCQPRLARAIGRFVGRDPGDRSGS
jgi:class 3 adenylate cyclase